MASGSIRSTGLDRAALVALLLLVFGLTLANAAPGRTGLFDHQFIDIADNLVSARVFALERNEAGAPEPTAVREPVQPAFLAIGLALLFDEDGANPSCMFEYSTPCPELLLSFKVVQALSIVALALLIYVAATDLCGRGWWAVVAVALFVLQGSAILVAATTFMSEPTAALLLTAHAVLLMRIARDPGRGTAAVLAGVTLGLLVLTKAIFIFYILAGLGLVALLLPFARARRHRAFRPAAVVMTISFLIMSGWIARNIVVVDTPLLTQRGNGVLVRRIEHATMPWRETAASFVYFAPYVGEELAEAWLRPEDYVMLTRDHEDGYHARIRDGGGVVNARTAANLAAADDRLSMLIQVVTPLQVMIENLPNHLVLTASFMWRGMGVKVLDRWTGISAIDRIVGVAARIFTILLVPAIFYSAFRAVRRPHWPALLFMAPALYSILIHAFITHNLSRFTAPVVPCAIVALVWLLHGLTGRSRTQGSGTVPSAETT